jgi:two-component system NtrC family response regulator/two-component system response regulator AtoC
MDLKRILICDDEEPMRQLLRVVLDGAYEFDEAADGPAALDAARRARPDLVILDLMLPGTGGMAVLEELRGDPGLASVPVIVVTAWPQMEEEAARAGANRFFMKPFEPDAMQLAVEELLEP